MPETEHHICTICIFEKTKDLYKLEPCTATTAGKVGACIGRDTLGLQVGTSHDC